MFTGIIEAVGTLQKIEKEGTNVHFTVESSLSTTLEIDQSLSHNGVCLTVVDLDKNTHRVTAIEETLKRTNLGRLQPGDSINLEKAMLASARLDGHLVQGHVDATGNCVAIESVSGSWYFRFRYQPKPEYLLVDKGSICVNGVSLTVVEPSEDSFCVAIIPYTFEHTNFKDLQVDGQVNLEFDVIGKYIARHIATYRKLIGN